MAKVVYAPDPLPVFDRTKRHEVTFFLAGSIDMGKAEDWQARVIKIHEHDDDIIFFNPRRPDWDSSWKQTIDNKQFREQVEWELDALEKADFIIMYFAPNSVSPITLLEFGLYAKTRKLRVICPKEYWRRGNVEITCKRYDVPFYEKFEDYFEKPSNKSSSL